MCSDRPPPLPRQHSAHARRSRGFTLPEALLALVVIGIGLAGLMLAFGNSLRGDGDALVQRQMGAIAQELLEEIQLKPYAAVANTAPAGCARDTFNDLNDYNGYSSSGVCTIDGVVVAQLSGYSVSVTVAAATLNGVSAARRIVITVGQGGRSLQLVGWRTDYAS